MKKVIIMLTILLLTSAGTAQATEKPQSIPAGTKQAQSAGKPLAFAGHQFVFKGSLDLSEIDKRITHAMVMCGLYSGNTPIGYGSVEDMAIGPNGTLKHSFVVNANVGTGYDPSSVSSYMCDLRLYTISNKGVSKHYGSRANVWLPKKGTTTIHEYRGTFDPITKKAIKW